MDRLEAAFWRGLINLKFVGIGVAIIMELIGCRNTNFILYIALGSFIGGFTFQWVNHGRCSNLRLNT